MNVTVLLTDYSPVKLNKFRTSLMELCSVYLLFDHVIIIIFWTSERIERLSNVFVIKWT